MVKLEIFKNIVIKGPNSPHGNMIGTLYKLELDIDLHECKKLVTRRETVIPCAQIFNEPVKNIVVFLDKDCK